MIQLRKYTPSDLPYFKQLVSDPNVMKKVDGVLPEVVIRQLFNEFITNTNCLVWVIESNITKKYIGHVALLNDDSSPLSKEIIFYIAKKYWNMGYGKRAAELTIKLAFQQNICEKVIATVDADHKFSRKILESIGMKVDYWDEEAGETWPVYSITKE